MSENVIGELKNENPKDLIIDEFCAFNQRDRHIKLRTKPEKN